MEHTATIGPEFDGVLHQVGACTFNQMDQGQPLFLCHTQHTQCFTHRRSRRRTGIDAAVVDEHHTAHTADKTDTTDHAGPGDTAVRALVIDQIVSHIVELKKWQAWIE